MNENSSKTKDPKLSEFLKLHGKDDDTEAVDDAQTSATQSSSLDSQLLDGISGREVFLSLIMKNLTSSRAVSTSSK